MIIPLLILLNSFYFNIGHTDESNMIKVVIVDTGMDLEDPRFKSVLCKTGHKDFTHTTIKDVIGHGVHVAGLIKQYAGEENQGRYCLIIYKYYKEYAGGEADVSAEIQAFYEAGDMGAVAVNFSGGGPGETRASERESIRTHPRTKYIVAAGNEGKSFDDADYSYYPASYNLPNMIVVGNKDNKGIKAPSSNYGSMVVYEVGTEVESTLPNGATGTLSGTSMSTAIRTGKYINELLR